MTGNNVGLENNVARFCVFFSFSFQGSDGFYTENWVQSVRNVGAGAGAGAGAGGDGDGGGGGGGGGDSGGDEVHALEIWYKVFLLSFNIVNYCMILVPGRIQSRRVLH